jgi:hypothetical protein
VNSTVAASSEGFVLPDHPVDGLQACGQVGDGLGAARGG